MTDEIYFDTDCLSHFLRVKEQRILVALYSGRIAVPMIVYQELSSPLIKQYSLKTDIDILIKNKHVLLKKMEPESLVEEKYYEILYNTKTRIPGIGKGEASVMSFAFINQGVMASNNLKDVRDFVKEHQIKNLTTADILIEAFKMNVISRFDVNEIWHRMLKHGAKLPNQSFDEFEQLKEK